MFHRNPILILFRALARRMGHWGLAPFHGRRGDGLTPLWPADPPLVSLGPGGDFTRYWPERPPQRGIVQ